MSFWTTTSGQFFDTDNNWELLQSFQIRQVINRNNLFEYQLGFSGSTRPFPRVIRGSETIIYARSQETNIKATDAWLRLNWLHRLHKDWLYVKVSPEVSYPRYNNYDFTPAVYVELEAFFSTSPSMERIRINY